MSPYRVSIGQPHDLLGSLRGDFLDVDTARGTHHEHRLFRRPVEDDADIGFARDIGGVGDEHLLHRQPLDLHAEDAAGDLARLFRRFRELHTASFPASAGMHLRLHDDGAPDAPRDLLGLVGCSRDITGRNRNAVTAQDVLRLVFVDVHLLSE